MEAVLRVSAVGARLISSSMAGEPLARPRVSSASKPSVIVAISPSSTFSPPVKDLTSTLASSRAPCAFASVRNWRSTAPSTVPDGRSRLLSAIAAETSEIFMSRRRSSISGTSIRISALRRPVKSILSMPRSMSSSRMRLAQARLTTSSALPKMASLATVSKNTDLAMVGSSASSGRLPTALTAVSTSVMAWLISVPSANSSRRLADPSEAVDVMRSTPET